MSISHDKILIEQLYETAKGSFCRRGEQYREGVRAVGGVPVLSTGQRSRIYDMTGRNNIDYVGSWVR
jgi:glutamate-1-semialdehyde aminotransferase